MAVDCKSQATLKLFRHGSNLPWSSLVKNSLLAPENELDTATLHYVFTVFQEPASKHCSETRMDLFQLQKDYRIVAVPLFELSQLYFFLVLQYDTCVYIGISLFLAYCVYADLVLEGCRSMPQPGWKLLSNSWSSQKWSWCTLHHSVWSQSRNIRCLDSQPGSSANVGLLMRPQKVLGTPLWWKYIQVIAERCYSSANNYFIFGYIRHVPHAYMSLCIGLYTTNIDTLIHLSYIMYIMKRQQTICMIRN